MLILTEVSVSIMLAEIAVLRSKVCADMEEKNK